MVVHHGTIEGEPESGTEPEKHRQRADANWLAFALRHFAYRAVTFTIRPAPNSLM